MVLGLGGLNYEREKITRPSKPTLYITLRSSGGYLEGQGDVAKRQIIGRIGVII